jgi:hypothetical protein
MEKELRDSIARDCKRLMRESKKLIKRSREIFRYELVTKRPQPGQQQKLGSILNELLAPIHRTMTDVLPNLP